MPKSSAPFVRNPYNYDTVAASNECGILCEDPTLTQQNFADECDINNIISTFVRTGDAPLPNLTPLYGDFSGVRDFHSALNQVLAIQESFMELNPDVRSRFGNDPQNLMNFLEDPNNRTEAIELGLVSGDLSTPAAGGLPKAKAKAGVDKSVKDVKSSGGSSDDDLGGV